MLEIKQLRDLFNISNIIDKYLTRLLLLILVLSKNMRWRKVKVLRHHRPRHTSGLQWTVQSSGQQLKPKLGVKTRSDMMALDCKGLISIHGIFKLSELVGRVVEIQYRRYSNSDHLSRPSSSQRFFWRDLAQMELWYRLAMMMIIGWDR